jgi:Asp/Glu/hydantoin racemase
MTVYRARKGQVSYGEAIGILLLDTHIPFPPGDVGNATTFSFPVRYRVVEGASIERLINQRDPTLLQPFITAGWELIKEGVKAITGDCGFMILFQEQLASEFNVPVFMSSLLQLPFISRMLRAGEKVGVITADSRNLAHQHLEAAGVTDFASVRVAGMQDQVHFYQAILDEKGGLDFEKVEAEVVQVAKNLVAGDEKIKAILLECSDLPPYAASVQEAVNLPVFDYTTMINYVFSALVRKRFHGYL